MTETKSSEASCCLESLPYELLVIHIFEKHLTLKDWVSLQQTCQFLQRIVEDYVSDFNCARCCFISFRRNKGDTSCSLPSSLLREPETYQLFGNGMSCDNLLILKDAHCYHSILPRAFEMNRDSLPEVLKTDKMDEVRKMLLVGFNYPLLQDNEDIWWLPNFKKEETLREHATCFVSWKDCYLQHLQANTKLDEVLLSLKEKPFYPSLDLVYFLCEKVKQIFANEPNVLPLQPPLVVIGDTHGQWANMINIFEHVGWPGDKEFLFLGDYVNRGKYSIPSILLLFALKIKFPHRVHLLRGSSEAHTVSAIKGLATESEKIYGDTLAYDAICETFSYMPLAALIGEKVFATHGGLSPCIDNLHEIQIVNRVIENPIEGPVCDLLWSDPDDIDGWGISYRGAGYTWGKEITSKFLRNNNLTYMLRSHQLVMEGFCWMHDNQILTIFSAANYCYAGGNLGGIAIINESCEAQCVVFEGVVEC